MSTWHLPEPFPGTERERLANRDTHRFVTWDPMETPECERCLAKTWHVAADWPCGTEPPRIEVERDDSEMVASITSRVVLDAAERGVIEL